MRGAAEHQRLDRQQPRIVRHVHLDPAVEPRAVEQDRFLRQPFQRSTRPEGEPRHPLRRRVDGAIDLLGRLAGHDGLRPRPGRHPDLAPVAAGDAARQVCEHRFRHAVRGARRQDPHGRAGIALDERTAALPRLEAQHGPPAAPLEREVRR